MEPQSAPSIAEIVDVVLVRTEASAATAARLASLLAADELARIERRRRHDHRRRDTIVRATLRLLLGQRLGCDPRALQLQAGELGKPALADGGCRFSISRSGVLAAFALARREVGVDIELMRDTIDGVALASRLFTRVEAERIHTAADRTLAFYQIWTAKEAVLKATGRGMSLGLGCFEVPPLAAAPQRIRIDDPVDVAGWSVARCEVMDGYCGAVALAGEAPWCVATRWEDVEEISRAKA